MWAKQIYLPELSPKAHIFFEQSLQHTYYMGALPASGFSDVVHHYHGNNKANNLNLGHSS